MRVPQGARRDVQRVGRRPRSIGRGVRICHGAVAAVSRSGPRLAGRVSVDLVPFPGSEPRRPGTFRRPAVSPVPAER